jgi:RNA polymerase sigma factor (sigma-70 family)
MPEPRGDGLVREYAPLVASIGYRMIEDRDLAREAVQEAWVEILGSLTSFEGASKLSTWIYSVAARTISRFARRERLYAVRAVRLVIEDEQEPRGAGDDAERRRWAEETCDRCVTGSLHCLTGAERLVYLLYDVAGMKSAEIGEIVSMSAEAVRKVMSRSRRRLRSFLSDDCGLYNPDGGCRCRASAEVAETKLRDEVRRIREDIREISFLAACGKAFSPHEEFVREICHRYS